MLEQFLTHLAGDTRAVADAPLLFIGLAAIIAASVYVVTRWRYGMAISDLQGRLKLSTEQVADFCKTLSAQSPDEAKGRF